jgi:uncharacterized membrane protein (UPF0136 family)
VNTRYCLGLPRVYKLIMLKIYLIVFAIATIAGGIQGKVTAGSNASVIAGTICGGLLLAGAFLLASKTTLGLALALIGALAIAGRFTPVFFKAPDKMAALWPAGAMAILGIVAVVWLIYALVKR